MSKLATAKSAVKSKSNSPWKNRAGRAAEQEDKRMAVLTTAAELFVTRGFHGTTLNDVAERLNITKPAIYYYFANKDVILIECTKAALTATEEFFAQHDDEKLKGRERLARFMVWYGVSMTTPFGKCLVRVAEQDVDASTHKQLVAAKRVIYERLKTLIDTGISDGSIDTADANVAAFTIAGALSWLSHWHKPDGKLTAQQAAESITALLMHGLGPATKAGGR
jgi:AcrR family transcriptional regulator